MPQMNPSMWLNIYLVSFMVFLMMMIYTFYFSSITTSVNTTKINKPQLPSWVW
uniref:ATP synthase F0 subunit 8 n=1 Tax=Neomysis japonica TaxID=1676841 RepID=A0A0U2DB14_9CRUS|nr:ATP synthase F0 subunit 8 [Neomysis japonica]AKO62614.1 ATP synthase F0 subunit 8 [Neomysis japonica]